MDDEVDMLEDEDGSVIVVDDVDLVVDEIEEVEGPVRDRCVCMCVCVCGWLCEWVGIRVGVYVRERGLHAVTTCLPRCVSKGRSGARRLRCSHFASRRAGGRVVHQADEQAAGRSNRNAAEHDGATVDTQARM